MPRPLIRSFAPLLVPGGIVIVTGPSKVGTSTFYTGRHLHIDRLKFSIPADLQRQCRPARRLLERERHFVFHILPARGLAPRTAGTRSTDASSHARSPAPALSEQLIEHVPKISQIKILDAH